MANFYKDNKDLRFHLTHPVMEKIVRLKEMDYRDKDLYDYAPHDYEDAMDNRKWPTFIRTQALY